MLVPGKVTNEWCIRWSRMHPEGNALSHQWMHSLHNSCMHSNSMHSSSISGSMHISSLHIISMHSSILHSSSMHSGSLHSSNLHINSMHSGSMHSSILHIGIMHSGSLHSSSLQSIIPLQRMQQHFYSPVRNLDAPLTNWSREKSSETLLNFPLLWFHSLA